MTEHRSDEKRVFSRIAFDSDVQVTDGHGDWESTLLDISLKGVLMKTPPGWHGQPGDRCRLRIRLHGGEAEINMQATVAHVEEQSIGFRCDSLDSDSATHLRRLVELNLGDEALLNRELAALAGDAGK